MTDDQPSIDSDWIDTDAPAEGQIVQVRAQNGLGFYVLPLAVVFHDDDWWNARTGEPLDCYVAGWRPMKGSVEDTCKMSSQTGLRGANTLGEPSNQAS